MVYTKELGEAAVEVLEMLEHCSQEVLSKIPTDFINYLLEIQSFDYYFEYDASKKLEDQNFSKEALYLIGMIYKDYICDEKEKSEYMKVLKKTADKIEQEKVDKYRYEDIFKNEKSMITEEHSNSLVEYKKENFFRCIIKKLKAFFRKK